MLNIVLIIIHEAILILMFLVALYQDQSDSDIDHGFDSRILLPVGSHNYYHINHCSKQQQCSLMIIDNRFCFIIKKYDLD